MLEYEELAISRPIGIGYSYQFLTVGCTHCA